MFKVIILVFFGTILLALTSCDEARIMDENHEIPEAVWTIDNIQEFQFELDDLSQQYSFLVNVRNTNDYAYNNLYLFVEITGTDNKFYRDTLQVVLANNSGRWTGSGIGNLWHTRLPFIKAAKMTEKGPYTVRIGHGMREDTIMGISDIGFRVEKI